MANYRCPVCGRLHQDLDGLSGCVELHKKNEKTEAEKAKQARVAELKSTINKAVKELESTIAEFNRTSTEEKCTLNVSFSTLRREANKNKESWERINDTIKLDEWLRHTLSE